MGGAVDALLFHIIEAETRSARIRQAPSAQVVVAADRAGLNTAGSVTIVCHVAVHGFGSHGRCAGGSAGGSAGWRAGGREKLSTDRHKADKPCQGQRKQCNDARRMATRHGGCV